MKIKTKIILASLVVLLVGVVLSLVGLVKGGQTAIEFNGFHISLGSVYGKNQEVTKEKLAMFSNLDVKAEIATIEVIEGDDYGLEFVGDGSTLKYEQEGDKLKIVQKSRNVFGINIGIQKEDIKLVLTVPKETKLGNVKVEMGVGSLEIRNIKCDNLELDLGVGETILKNIMSKGLDVDCGVGSTFIQGQVLGVTKIDGGIGEIELNLIGNEKDYRIDASVGIGEMSYNGKSLAGSGSIKEGTGEYLLDVNGGVGNITITVGE